MSLAGRLQRRQSAQMNCNWHHCLGCAVTFTAVVNVKFA